MFSLTSRLDHLTDHDLEQYYLGILGEGAELAALEEHLLGCPECVARAEASDAYVDAIRSALLRSGDPPQALMPRNSAVRARRPSPDCCR